MANFTCSVKSSTGPYILIDFEDLGLLSACNWWVGHKNGYAHGRPTQAMETILMHRLLMNAGPGQEVDHIDGNRLNNSRSNLRFCTRRLNNGNARISISNTSGYKGVSWQPDRGKWQAGIGYNNKRIPLGRFYTAEEAARAYNKAALELFGEFARLNVIPEIEKRERLAA